MKRIFSVNIFLIVALILVAASSTVLAQPDYTIKTSNNQLYGTFLVDGQGRTLYYFTKDEPGISNCKGQCAVNWPPFYTSGIAVPPGLNATDFGTITRDDGLMQTTFRGWPLYYFNKDAAVGDIKGQKVINAWFVVAVDE